MQITELLLQRVAKRECRHPKCNEAVVGRTDKRYCSRACKNKAVCARYYVQYPEKAKAVSAHTYTKRLLKEPSYNAENTARRAARLAGFGGRGSVSVENWSTLPSFCVYCLTVDNLETEHSVPLTRGGWHIIDNVTTACRPCNTSKGNNLLEEWFEEVV